MRLAARLGMTLAELDARMSSSELTQWMAFDTLEPIDSERRADLRAGIIASTIANCHRRRDAQPFKPSDFMPDFDGSMKVAQESPGRMLEVAKALAATGMGTITTGG